VGSPLEDQLSNTEQTVRKLAFREERDLKVKKDRANQKPHWGEKFGPGRKDLQEEGGLETAKTENTEENGRGEI